MGSRRARRSLVVLVAAGLVASGHALAPAVAEPGPSGPDDPPVLRAAQPRPVPPAPQAAAPETLPGSGPTPAPIPLVEPGEPGPVPIPLVEPEELPRRRQ